MKICFVIYEQHDEKPKQAVFEAIDFIQQYIPLETTLIEISEDIEPSFWDNYDCYFAHAGDFSRLIDKIPEGYDIYVCLWKAKGKPVCWSGGTWGIEYGIHNAWLCSIPYDLPDCFDTVGDQYRYRLSQRITHEVLNAFHGMGIIEYSPERCPEYGFKDPKGWRDCYVYCLKSYKGGEKVGEWKEVWSSGMHQIRIVKPETPFQPRIKVVTENLRIPEEANAGDEVYCGDIQIRSDSDVEVLWRAVTLVNGQEVNPEEGTVKIGKIETYVPWFVAPSEETVVDFEVKVFEWVES